MKRQRLLIKTTPSFSHNPTYINASTAFLSSLTQFYATFSSHHFSLQNYQNSVNQSTFMGACFSSESIELKPSANVISVDGQLRQYSVPITVSQVLRFESSSPVSIFLCDSDSLYFDDFIPALNGEVELDPDQIYFVLSTNKLQYRLAASDMAALAVKASVAMDQIGSRRRKSKARISPVLVAEEHPQANYQIQNKVSFNSPYSDLNGRKTTGIGVSRSGSTRKMQRLYSRRAKLAVRSFRIRLSTVYEGSVLHAD